MTEILCLCRQKRERAIKNYLPYIFLFLLLSRECCCVLKKIHKALRLKEINLPQ